jgi:amidophosphoribosyltransferase
MIETVEQHLNERKTQAILSGGGKLSAEKVTEILSERPRIEKIAIKDVKLRTFITEDSSRDDLVAHVYDVTYGVIKPTDNLVIIDDSIVRGTTLKMSIIKMMNRLNPKQIIVVSSAPQIRYPDCYGIDMANLESLIAFRAMLELLKDSNKYHLIEEVYNKCKAQLGLKDKEVKNYVKDLYSQFTADEISDKIAELISDPSVEAKVKTIFQPIENLHKACPKNLGDWYFTGNYPTPGGNRVVNRAFINFYEGNKERAY